MGGRIGWTEKRALIGGAPGLPGVPKDRAIASLRRVPWRAFDESLRSILIDSCV